MSRHYLDWNATAPVRPEAKEAFIRAMEFYGNPSSIHAEGRGARNLLEESRAEVAEFMGCLPEEVVFTSGGFEANNIALASHAANAAHRSFAASAIEHGSILGKLETLAAMGWERVQLAVTREGFIDPASLTRPVGFAVFQAMNQETGALHDLDAFGARCAELSVPWHCDAVQLWGRLPFTVAGKGFSSASLTGHKIGAPKGTGALFARKGFSVTPLMHSGPQERSRRPGTENTPGAAALAAAVRVAGREAAALAARLAPLRGRMIEEARKLFPGVLVNGPTGERVVPNTLSLSFPEVEGSLLVQALDLEGIALSAGSACASGATKPSPVLTAMGVGEPAAKGALRISMGWETTPADVEAFIAALGRVLARLPGPRA